MKEPHTINSKIKTARQKKTENLINDNANKKGIVIKMTYMPLDSCTNFIL